MNLADETLRLQRKLSFYHGQKKLAVLLVALPAAMIVLGLAQAIRGQLTFTEALKPLLVVSVGLAVFARAHAQIKTLEVDLGSSGPPSADAARE